MSDPRITHQHGATPWGGPGPRQGPPPHPEPLGSPAHPQAPDVQYLAPPAGQNTGQHQVPADAAYRPPRRRLPSTQLPEPPAGLAVGAIVAACCLLFVELAELAILLVTGDRGAAGAGIGAGVGLRFDPNGDTVTALFGLAAYVAACVWLQACRRLAVAANPSARFAHGPVWTWLGWWVPIVSLWVPYQVVRDLRGAAVRAGERRVGLGLWWPFWLLAGLRLVSSSSADAEVVVRAVSAVALTLAFVQWVRIIQEITRAQERAAGFS